MVPQFNLINSPEIKIEPEGGRVPISIVMGKAFHSAWQR
jgi:hypothetical protein